jgi:hypothetical protein
MTRRIRTANVYPISNLSNLLRKKLSLFFSLFLQTQGREYHYSCTALLALLDRQKSPENAHTIVFTRFPVTSRLVIGTSCWILGKPTVNCLQLLESQTQFQVILFHGSGTSEAPCQPDTSYTCLHAIAQISRLSRIFLAHELVRIFSFPQPRKLFQNLNRGVLL